MEQPHYTFEELLDALRAALSGTVLSLMEYLKNVGLYTGDEDELAHDLTQKIMQILEVNQELLHETLVKVAWPDEMVRRDMLGIALSAPIAEIIEVHSSHIKADKTYATTKLTDFISIALVENYHLQNTALYYFANIGN